MPGAAAGGPAPEAPRLRDGKTYRLLKQALLAGCDRFGFRLAHYSVQANHVHLICEGKDKDALARGMGGCSLTATTPAS